MFVMCTCMYNYVCMYMSCICLMYYMSCTFEGTTLPFRLDWIELHRYPGYFFILNLYTVNKYMYKFK